MAEKGIEHNETAAKEALKREEEREQEGGGFGDFGGEGGGDYHSGGQSKNNAGHKGSHRHHRNYHRHHSLSELMSREDAELDGDVLPIEYRNVYRGGMTAARDLEYALASPETIWGASSFMEIDQGSVGSASSYSRFGCESNRENNTYPKAKNVFIMSFIPEMRFRFHSFSCKPLSRRCRGLLVQVQSVF